MASTAPSRTPFGKFRHVTRNSGKYILTPVVSESGTDVPIEPTDDEREGGLNATFVGTVSQGENATVSVNDEDVETTAAGGRITFEVPRDEVLEVEVTTGDAETELEVEFETEDERENVVSLPDSGDE